MLVLSISSFLFTLNIDFNFTLQANADVTDFMYICPSHLNDPGFAKPALSPSSTASTTTSTVPQSEIDKVKKEYEDRLERKKAASSSEKDKDKESKGWIASGFSGLGSLASSAASSASNSLFPPTPPSPPPTTASASTAVQTGPKAYILHRDIFSMRTTQARKKWEAKVAKERLQGLNLPSAPRGGLRPVG